MATLYHHEQNDIEKYQETSGNGGRRGTPLVLLRFSAESETSIKSDKKSRMD